MLVAEKDGFLIGTASVVPAERGEYELVRVAVLPEHRGAGVGLRLVREAVGVARAVGARRLWWVSDPFQDRAHRIYERVAGSPTLDQHGRRHYAVVFDSG